MNLAWTIANEKGIGMHEQQSRSPFSDNPPLPPWAIPAHSLWPSGSGRAEIRAWTNHYVCGWISIWKTSSIFYIDCKLQTKCFAIDNRKYFGPKDCSPAVLGSLDSRSGLRLYFGIDLRERAATTSIWLFTPDCVGETVSEAMAAAAGASDSGGSSGSSTAFPNREIELAVTAFRGVLTHDLFNNDYSHLHEDL